jgi:hypothetical protein
MNKYNNPLFVTSNNSLLLTQQDAFTHNKDNSMELGTTREVTTTEIYLEKLCEAVELINWLRILSSRENDTEPSF